MSGNYSTVRYASPEIIKKNLKDKKCDIWQCGLIFYEMITNKRVINVDKHI